MRARVAGGKDCIMESVVGKLLDVDREARMILDEAQQYYDATIEEIAAEKKRMTADYEARATKHLEDVKRAESGGMEQAADEIHERYARLTAAIDGTYAQNHAEWEDELYKRCMGR